MSDKNWVFDKLKSCLLDIVKDIELNRKDINGICNKDLKEGFYVAARIEIDSTPLDSKVYYIKFALKEE